ncbi:hypothetical protein ACO34A_19265 [Rhizobium sp. ACO-34A]|nr:hypothetical protein ACO34A_19265 [Rhizobium sp. ACO-34A]
MAELAALIFGAHQASPLAASGRLQAVSIDVTQELDRIFATRRLPHSGISF